MIVVAADRSDHAAEVVREAEALAALTVEPLRVVHVLTRGEFLDLQRASTEDTGKPVEIDRVRALAKREAQEAIDAADAENAEAVGLMGKPGESVAQYADDHDARYVVAGYRRRSPAGKVVFGSVAQQILRESSTPVLMIGGR
jgi:nucleotide-binding universal stress UspA family protein